MLPPQQRLCRRPEFTEVVRRGRRASRPLLTVHLLVPGATGRLPAGAAVTKAGLVVSRAVGGSVVRHRTARRLRHLLRDRITALAPGSRLVVRAAPAAGAACSARLGHDLDGALGSAVRAAAAAR